MLNKVVIGRYYPTKSLIHSLNPVIKLLSLIIFLTSVFLGNNLVFFMTMAVLLFLMISFSNVKYKLFVDSLNSFKYFLLLVIVLGIINQNPGELIIINCLRLSLIILYTTLLTLTTMPIDLTKGLEDLLYPLSVLGIPIKKLSLILSLSLRFIPVLAKQANMILDAQAVRGVNYYEKGIDNKIKAISNTILPMFVLSFKNSSNLTETMEMRYYNDSLKTTNCRIKKISMLDIIILIMHVSPLVVFYLN